MVETERGPVGSVLLVDGDNDPHLPPEFPLGPDTLVRVFLRPGASIPRGLERRLAGLPQCVAVLSPKAGKNAADFVMALHAGLLHAALPMHVPFTLVTADKSLAAMAQELQRIGRQALLWTSHTAAGRVRKAKPQPKAAARRPARSVAHKERGAAGPTAQAAAHKERGTAGSTAQAADAYARRLASIKDPPGKLKSLLNDITNRTPGFGVTAEAVLEELKRRGLVTVDERGRVQRR
jgi:hypothetical protein